MNLLDLFRRQPKADPTPVQPAPAKKRVLKRSAVNMFISRIKAIKEAAAEEKGQLAAAKPMPGVVPPEEMSRVLAMDSTPYATVNELFIFNNAFLGYPFLAELAQLPEYRKMNSTLADEMTREWIELIYTGPEEGAKAASDKLKALNESLKKFNLRETFNRAFTLDSQFGRCQLYINVRKGSSQVLARTDPNELKTVLALDPKKIAKGALVGFTVVEPMWSYPGLYNSTDPLAEDYYLPTMWYVNGKAVDASRMITLIANPVPDMLKAVYSFGGVSLNQLAKPYVDNWIRTRQSVSDIIHNFSTSGLLTDLSALMSDPSAQEGGADVMDRSRLFTEGRDNLGLMLLNKDGENSEEFFQFNVPLGNLDKLQAQAQEHMAAVCSIPLVKLLGVTPSGLNASSDGEIRTFYDFILSQQEQYRPAIKRAIDVIQLSENGEIDPSIDFKFVPLYQETETDAAAARKTDAETDQILINAGVIAQEESRARISQDPESPYAGIEVADVPEPEELPEPQATTEDPAAAGA